MKMKKRLHFKGLRAYLPAKLMQLAAYFFLSSLLSIFPCGDLGNSFKK
jgi:hypothetical protein